MMVKVAHPPAHFEPIIPENLTKYICPDCRHEIAKACISSIQQLKNDGKINNRASASTILAHELGLHRKTTARWEAHGIQGSNVNIEKLIKIGLELCPNRILSLIEEDMETYRNAYIFFESDVNRNLSLW